MISRRYKLKRILPDGSIIRSFASMSAALAAGREINLDHAAYVIWVESIVADMRR